MKIYNNGVGGKIVFQEFKVENLCLFGLSFK